MTGTDTAKQVNPAANVILLKGKRDALRLAKAKQAEEEKRIKKVIAAVICEGLSDDRN